MICCSPYTKGSLTWPELLCFSVTQLILLVILFYTALRCVSSAVLLAAQNITKKIQVDSEKTWIPVLEWWMLKLQQQCLEPVRSELWKALKRVEPHSMVSEMPIAELKLGRFPKGLGRFFKRYGIYVTEIRKQEVLTFSTSTPSLLQLPGKGTDGDESLSFQQSICHANSDSPELHLEAKRTGKELSCFCSPVTSDKPPWNQ